MTQPLAIYVQVCPEPTQSASRKGILSTLSDKHSKYKVNCVTPMTHMLSNQVIFNALNSTKANSKAQNSNTL